MWPLGIKRRPGNDASPPLERSSEGAPSRQCRGSRWGPQRPPASWHVAPVVRAEREDHVSSGCCNARQRFGGTAFSAWLTCKEAVRDVGDHAPTSVVEQANGGVVGVHPPAPMECCVSFGSTTVCIADSPRAFHTSSLWCWVFVFKFLIVVREDQRTQHVFGPSAAQRSRHLAPVRWRVTRGGSSEARCRRASQTLHGRCLSLLLSPSILAVLQNVSTSVSLQQKTVTRIRQMSGPSMDGPDHFVCPFVHVLALTSHSPQFSSLLHISLCILCAPSKRNESDQLMYSSSKQEDGVSGLYSKLLFFLTLSLYCGCDQSYT